MAGCEATPTRGYTTGSSDGGASCCKDPTDRAAVAVAELSEAVSGIAALRSTEASLAVVRLVVPKAGRLGAQKNWTDKESLARARALLDEARDAQERFGQGWGHAIVSQIAALCRTFVDDLSRRKEEQALLDFQDLLLRTRDMLQGNREARRYFKREFKHLLVDEFQDTDPLQTEIVFFLAEQDDKLASDWREVGLAPGKLFVVGDPKQSIYRFRRADIELFQQVGELVTQTGGRVELSQNFRSLSGVIERANDLFAKLIHKPEDGNYQPDYVPLVSWWERPGGAVLLYPPEGFDATAASADACRANEATCLAEFIQRAATTQEFPVFERDCERPLEYRDIALLFRVTTGLDAYEDALRDYGIPYLITGGRRFYARQEIKALVAVLRAVDDPHDDVALYAALKSPFFGLSDEQLFLHFHETGSLRYTAKPAGDGPVAEALHCLRRLHASRNRGSTPRLLLELFEETKALELFALKPLGEQRVANLLKVIDTARTLETTGGLTFRQFVSWLRDMEQNEQEEAESPTAEAADNFVHLLTVHKAKGLEYPLVILANPAGGQPHPENLLVDRGAGALHLKLGSSKLPFQSTGFATAQERERERWKAEEIRLFYVAVTRAKNWFVMPVGWNKGGLDKAQGLIQFARPMLPTLEQAIPGQVVNGWYCYDTRQLSLTRPEQEPFRVPLDPDSSLTGEAQTVLTQREEWRTAKGKAVERAGRAPVVIRPSDLADEDRVRAAVRPSDAPGGKKFGEFVHRLLEKADVEDLAAVAAKAAAELRLPPEVAAEALELVGRALASPLLQRARQATAKWHELPFSLKTDEGVVEGTIDLVFREGDGLVVVDFKTDQVGPDGAEEAAEAYAPQLRQYAGALAKLTGMTVSETIVLFLRPLVEVRQTGEGT
jgi:ATP-dependent helicase/nuclease subunit A